MLNSGCDPSNPVQWLTDQDRDLEQWKQDSLAASRWLRKEAPPMRPGADNMLGYIDEKLMPQQGFEEFMGGVALGKRALKKSIGELRAAVLSWMGREFEPTMNAGGALRAKGEDVRRKAPTAASRPAEAPSDLNPQRPWICESPIQEIGGELHPSVSQ